MLLALILVAIGGMLIFGRADVAGHLLRWSCGALLIFTVLPQVLSHGSLALRNVAAGAGSLPALTLALLIAGYAAFSIVLARWRFRNHRHVARRDADRERARGRGRQRMPPFGGDW